MTAVQANVDFGGSARAGQNVNVYNHGTQVAATIYDTDGVTLLSQPIPVRGNGHVSFSAAPGTYDVVGSDLTRTVVLVAAPTAASGSTWVGPLHYTFATPDSTPWPELIGALGVGAVIEAFFISEAEAFDGDVYIDFGANGGQAGYLELANGNNTGEFTVGDGSILVSLSGSTGFPALVKGDASGLVVNNAGPITTGDAQVWVRVAPSPL